ncbi:MAG: hypothetical protein ACR2G2_06650 [Pseudonocardia sp.]
MRVPSAATIVGGSPSGPVLTLVRCRIRVTASRPGLDVIADDRLAGHGAELRVRVTVDVCCIGRFE